MLKLILSQYASSFITSFPDLFCNLTVIQIKQGSGYNISVHLILALEMLSLTNTAALLLSIDIRSSFNNVLKQPDTEWCCHQHLSPWLPVGGIALLFPDI